MLKIAMLRVLCLLCLATEVHANENFVEKKANHFAFQVPREYVVKNISPQFADFELIEVRPNDGSNTYLTIYIGNAPHFPTLPWGVPSKVEAGEKRRREFYAYRDDVKAFEGLITFDGLTYKGYQGTPYGQVHYFASGIDKESASRLLRIVDSLKVVEPDLR